MSQKSEKFFDAITHIREDLIEEAQNHKFRKKTAAWKKYTSLAASIVLIVSIGFLAIVPRGCGSGGADSNSSAPFASSNDAAAPQDVPSTDTAPPPCGSSGASDPGEPPSTDTPEEGIPSDAAELHQFTAIVIEVQGEALLAEPIEYDSHYHVLIPFTNLEFPALAEGDWITVIYAGDPILTSDPPLILGVQSIEKIDPAE